MARAWYVKTDGATPTIPANYTLVAGVPSCTSTNASICAVYLAYEDGTTPPNHPSSFSTNITNYIGASGGSNPPSNANYLKKRTA